MLQGGNEGNCLLAPGHCLDALIMLSVLDIVGAPDQGKKDFVPLPFQKRSIQAWKVIL